jgi:hypothetical protein
MRSGRIRIVWQSLVDPDAFGEQFDPLQCQLDGAADAGVTIEVVGMRPPKAARCTSARRRPRAARSRATTIAGARRSLPFVCAVQRSASTRSSQTTRRRDAGQSSVGVH